MVRREGCRVKPLPARRKLHPIYLLLLVPFAGLLWTPLFNRLDPWFLGIPFFYWYQMAWTFLAALCILPVYLWERRSRK
jgi:hypothetical protein